jgi:hypothetical protein
MYISPESLYERVSRIYNRNWKNWKGAYEILVEKLQGNMGDMGEGKIILKLMLGKYNVKGWTELNCFQWRDFVIGLP